MYFTYIIRCKDDSLYTGYTTCLLYTSIYYIVTEIIKIAVNTKDGKTPLKNFL